MSSGTPVDPPSGPTRWRRVQDLFHAAADLPAAEQRRFLEASSDGDTALVAEVEALLVEDRTPGSFLDRSLPEVAGHLLLGSETPGRVGSYRVLRLLGEGGMGVVYLVERDDVGGRAALKLLRDAWVSPSRRARFLSEQRTLAQLDHPAIAQLHDAGTLPDGTPWFAMEYVEGVPLTEYCRARGCGLAERLRLFRAVCEAVQHAHRHCRHPPGSQALQHPGEGRRGGEAARLRHRQADRPHRAGTDPTRTGLRLMTPAYAAPEQVEGGRLSVRDRRLRAGGAALRAARRAAPVRPHRPAAPRGSAAGAGAGASAPSQIAADRSRPAAPRGRTWTC
jgi:serine/threonine-protein kinase